MANPRIFMQYPSFTRRSLLDAAIRVAALPAGIAFFSAWTRAAEEHKHSSAAPSESETWTGYQPQFFSREDFGALAAFTEILIPSDETPGAREAHCADFIDFILHSSDGYAPEMQRQWRQALASLENCGFHAAPAERRLALVEEISKPERDSSARHPAFAAYRLIKRENSFAFYTSRAGSIEALDYRGNTYNIEFPACTHEEHHRI